MARANDVIVTVPTDVEMATEPARVIATAQRIKIALVAVLAVAGIIVSPELAENVDTLIQAGVAVVFGIYSLWSAYTQGEKTRAAVYAPASVATIAETAVADATVLPGRAADAVVPGPPPA